MGLRHSSRCLLLRRKMAEADSSEVGTLWRSCSSRLQRDPGHLHCAYLFERKRADARDVSASPFLIDWLVCAVWAHRQRRAATFTIGTAARCRCTLRLSELPRSLSCRCGMIATFAAIRRCVVSILSQQTIVRTWTRLGSLSLVLKQKRLIPSSAVPKERRHAFQWNV